MSLVVGDDHLHDFAALPAAALPFFQRLAVADVEQTNVPVETRRVQQIPVVQQAPHDATLEIERRAQLFRVDVPHVDVARERPTDEKMARTERHAFDRRGR